MDEPSSMSAEDAAAARAAEQARLRKERREAKIKAGGASRLNKITGLGGGIQRGTTPGSPFMKPPKASSAPSAAHRTGSSIRTNKQTQKRRANPVSQIRRRRRHLQRAHQPPPAPPTRVRSHPRNSSRRTRTQTRSTSQSTSTTPKPHNESPHSRPSAWTMRSYGR